MAINIQYAPAAGLVGQAGFQGGLADYQQRMRQNQIAQQELIQRDRMQSRGIAAQNYQQAYGEAGAQYRQGVGIADQQTEQLRTLANQQVMQANDIANQQYMQEQSLANSRFGTMMDVASRQSTLQQTLGFHAQQAAQGYAANQQSQMLAGDISSGLQAQQTAAQMGLSDQHFGQQAVLANMATGAQIDVNAAKLQNQLDFLPQLSEAQYQAQQTNIAQRGQALQDALSGGMITGDEFSSARGQLMNEQLGLVAKRPSTSDVLQEYAANVITPDPNYIVPGTRQVDQYGNVTNAGEPVRYVKNPRTGEFKMDPFSEQQFKQSQVQLTSQERERTAATTKKTTQQKMAMDAAVKLAPVTPGVPFTTLYINALIAIMNGLNPAPAGG